MWLLGIELGTSGKADNALNPAEPFLQPGYRTLKKPFKSSFIVVFLISQRSQQQQNLDL